MTDHVRTPRSVDVTNLAAVLLFYGAAPVRAEASSVRFALDLALAALGLLVVAAVVFREARGRRPGGRAGGLDARRLALLFEIVVVVFALSYFALAVRSGDSFVGIRTKIDALYFTMTTMTTVGYGDVHAESQLARCLVTAQLVFDIVFLAAVGAVFRSWVRPDGDSGAQTAGRE